MARKKRKTLSPLLIALPGVLLGGAALAGVLLLQQTKASDTLEKDELTRQLADEQRRRQAVDQRVWNALSFVQKLALSPNPVKTYNDLTKEELGTSSDEVPMRG